MSKSILYFAAVIPVLFYVGKWFCSGHYEIDRSFVRVDTTEDEGETFSGYNLHTLAIPIPQDRYDSNLHAWLLIPNSNVNSTSHLFPVVVMSHGIGGQKDMGLMRYGEEFVKSGYAVLLFDYRHFGGSYTLKPAPFRNFIHPWNHYEDIKVVVEYVKANGLGSFPVDSDKIVLWGTSFAGGHVIMAASELPPNSVSAVISQVPHLNGKEATKQAIASRGLIQSIRVVLIGLADIILSQVLQVSPPLYVKIAGSKESQEIGYMSLTTEQLDLYYSKHPKKYLGGWKNLAPARTLLLLSLYNPMKKLKNYSAAPVLFITAKQDDLCPPKFVTDSIADAKKHGVNLFSHLQVDTNHFGVYGGDHFEQAVSEMKSFLQKHLK